MTELVLLTFPSFSGGDYIQLALIIIALIVGWTKIKIQVDSLKNDLAEERKNRELSIKEAILRMEAIESRQNLLQERQHTTDITLTKLTVMLEENVVPGIAKLQDVQKQQTESLTEIKVMIAKNGK